MRAALATVACLVACGHSTRLEGSAPERHLQYGATAAAAPAYGGAQAAAAPAYGGAQAATYAAPAVYVQQHYNAPEVADFSAQKRTHYAAAYYDRGEKTVHREQYKADCGYAPATYTAPPPYIPAYKPKVAGKHDQYTTTEDHVVTETYNSPEEAAKAGYRRRLADVFAIRRVLTVYDANGCPKAAVVHDWTLLWLFIGLIILIILVWWCCRCFDAWCMWHPRRFHDVPPMGAAARRRKEQLEQLEDERERGIGFNGRRSEFTSPSGVPFGF